MKRRLSRPCYDKVWRCPGWIGGGFKYPRGNSRCNNGRIQIDYDDPLWPWKFWPCDRCNVLALPYMSRWLDPSWLKYTYDQWIITKGR